MGTPLTWGDWRGDVLRLRVRAPRRASRQGMAGLQQGRLRSRLPADAMVSQAKAGL